MHKSTNLTVNASEIAHRLDAIAAAGCLEVWYFIFDSNRAASPYRPGCCTGPAVVGFNPQMEEQPPERQEDIRCRLLYKYLNLYRIPQF